jgi:uncharacterized membrane protein YfcA
MGIGGGVVMVPLLTFPQIPNHMAIGTPQIHCLASNVESYLHLHRHDEMDTPLSVGDVNLVQWCLAGFRYPWQSGC